MSNSAQSAQASAHHAVAGRAELFYVVDAGKRMRPADGNAVVAVLTVDDAREAARNRTDRVGVTAQVDGLEDGVDVVVGVDEASEGRHEDVGDEARVRHGDAREVRHELQLREVVVRNLDEVVLNERFERLGGLVALKELVNIARVEAADADADLVAVRERTRRIDDLEAVGAVEKRIGEHAHECACTVVENVAAAADVGGRAAAMARDGPGRRAAQP